MKDAKLAALRESLTKKGAERALLKVEPNTVATSVKRAHCALLEKLKGATIIFLKVENALDLSPLLGEDFDKLSTIKVALIGRVTHMTARATELKEAVDVGMQGFEEGWLHYRW